MTVKLVPAGSLKPGNYIIIDGVACRIVDVKVSTPGKHGAAKARIEAIGLLDKKRRVIIVPTDSNVQVPVIEKRNAQVLMVSGDTATIMDLETFETFEADIDEEVKDKVQEGKEVVYWVIPPSNYRIIKQVKKKG